ncbi:hypothetical protein SUNI508_03577 [Seiridium unicorne]|uniref:Elongin-C n=1 Tax=Seiridium unicorne TaxID=138068 RepID=A0ABR2VB48_9PEZI
MADSAPSKYITLVSADEFEFVVLREAAMISPMIKSMLEIRGTGSLMEAQTGRCAFPEISGQVLEKVVEYFHYWYKNRDREDVPDMDIPVELCLELLMAADYLQLDIGTALESTEYSYTVKVDPGVAAIFSAVAVWRCKLTQNVSTLYRIRLAGQATQICSRLYQPHSTLSPGSTLSTTHRGRPPSMSRDSTTGGAADPPAGSSSSFSSQAQSEAVRKQLAALPDELLTQIFEAVGRISRRDLCAVSRVNKSWHELADAILYKSIRFDNPEQHLVFSESLSRRMRRGSAIQDISLEYPEHELSHLRLDGHIHGSHYAPTRFEALSRTISTMSNLETLEVSVPVTLLHGIGALFNGPFDLACLKSCTLFYQCPDDAYWDLRENIHIFAHPTLETLFIRRAKLDYRGFDFIERPHETALQKLHLIECDISDDALSDVLEFPEGLKEFVMTQTEKPSPELEESSDNVGDYIMALKSQSHSMETITVDHPTLTGRKPLRMRNFDVLKSLRMNWDYQLFGKSSKKPRLHSVGLPPELETLEFFNELGTDEEVTELLEYTLQVASVTYAKLRTIIVPQGDKGVPKEVVAACKTGGVKLDIIGAFDDCESDDEECEVVERQ